MTTETAERTVSRERVVVEAAADLLTYPAPTDYSGGWQSPPTCWFCKETQPNGERHDDEMCPWVGLFDALEALAEEDHYIAMVLRHAFTRCKRVPDRSDT